LTVPVQPSGIAVLSQRHIVQCSLHLLQPTRTCTAIN